MKKKITNKKVYKCEEYRAGFDCGINGANEENCHFRLFATPEQTKEWERGKKDADAVGRPPTYQPNPDIVERALKFSENSESSSISTAS